MLGVGAQSSVRTVPVYATFTDHRNAIPSSSISDLSFSSPFLNNISVRLCFSTKRCRFSKRISISCTSSDGTFDAASNAGTDPHADYLQASLLVTETILHYHMLKQGFQDEIKWQSSRKLHRNSVLVKASVSDFSSIGLNFFRRFRSPTVFLKISCDGDFLLPIIVGEFAIEKLMDAFYGNDDRLQDCPDQFQFMSRAVEELGYEVTMVRITHRVANTYYARLYFTELGSEDILCVDARPSDAINLAKRCEAPIYVNKEIVLADAFRIGFGMGRMQSTKSVYDVTLDSAADGPDLLSEEFNLVRNMNLAVEEERYNDAVLLKEKLMKLRKSMPEP